MDLNFRKIFMPEMEKAPLLATLSVGTLAASAAYYAGRCYTHLSGGQALGYGLLGACLSLAFVEAYEYLNGDQKKQETVSSIVIKLFFLAIGPFITEAFGENVFDHSLFVKDIIIVTAAALFTGMCAVHAYNLFLMAKERWLAKEQAREGAEWKKPTSSSSEADLAERRQQAG